MSFIRKLFFTVVFCCVLASLCALDVKVVEVSGKVEVQNGSKWVAVSKGDVLSAGAVISTGFKSEAVIALDETVIKVKALTRLTIEQLFEKDGNKASSVYLDTGSISADVKPAENKRVGFSVKTPAATASVRGTKGELYADGTLIGTGGKWCVTGPEEKLVFTQSVTQKVTSSETEEQSSGEPNGQESVSGPDNLGTEPVETETVEEMVAVGAWEDFDFDYPSIAGAVYVSAGENIMMSGNSFVMPQEVKMQETNGSAGVQLLSETEKVAPVAVQTFSEVAKPSAESIVVPEKPKYGTVEVTITMPAQLTPQSQQ